MADFDGLITRFRALSFVVAACRWQATVWFVECDFLLMFYSDLTRSYCIVSDIIAANLQNSTFFHSLNRLPPQTSGSQNTTIGFSVQVAYFARRAKNHMVHSTKANNKQRTTTKLDMLAVDLGTCCKVENNLWKSSSRAETGLYLAFAAARFWCDVAAIERITAVGLSYPTVLVVVMADVAVHRRTADTFQLPHHTTTNSQWKTTTRLFRTTYSLGPFYGAIAVPSVTRCRCCRCRGHRCAGGVRQ